MKPRLYFGIIISFFAFFILSGCASFIGDRTYRSTSVVDFLYPSKKPFVEPAIPTLNLPMRVGIVFVPDTPDNHSFRISEANKTMLMQMVSEQFKKLPYVQSVEAIPTTYLRPGGSFDNLDQLRSLLGIDVIVLLSYDQKQITTDSALTLSYWTIVGAYLVPAQKNNTATLFEAVVYDIESRKLLFRAPGTSIIKHNSTMVGTDDQRMRDSAQGFNEAATSLANNLNNELAAFKVRIKEKPEEIKVVAKPGYNLAAGALGWHETALIGVFIAMACAARLGQRAGTKNNKQKLNLL